MLHSLIQSCQLAATYNSATLHNVSHSNSVLWGLLSIRVCPSKKVRMGLKLTLALQEASAVRGHVEAAAPGQGVQPQQAL